MNCQDQLLFYLSTLSHKIWKFIQYNNPTKCF
uniref:Uncharacterized protein n=1 Tax=Rhizophora mucronata TaxID=61149 RepID=A0A2P2Q3P4_RHIMU